MNSLINTANEMAEKGVFPDAALRFGIRRLCKERIRQVSMQSDLDRQSFVAAMRSSPVAPVPDLANQQHYEVPAEFFEHALGEYRKYSCCYWLPDTDSLADAEAIALDTVCDRARIKDGMRVLDLGCGWGSLSLWIAQKYPGCSVTAVSNSSSQRKFIEKEAARFGFSNVSVITADMNDFSLDEKFDRVVSVEMFEHMRNYGVMFERISRWLTADGLFFMHIFCHRSSIYEFVDNGPADWMSRHFFSGGIMPSENLPAFFQDDLRLIEQWRWSGTHYQRTAEAWLQNMDRNRDSIMPVLAATYGPENAGRWWMRWRIFFLAVAEMFGTRNGEEWGVGHYLFQNSDSTSKD